ncbi:hypothetical protein B2J67_04440, partial [Vibrio cholerae]
RETQFSLATSSKSSTVGTNVSVLQRLSGLGMKADKIASPGFLAGITSQKLIPELCPSCKVSFVDERYQRAVFSA